MSKKTLKKNNRIAKTSGPKHQESVFREAWDNMNADMSRILPGFLAKRLQDRNGRLWLMGVITFVELVVLGVIGKFVYDWLMS